MSNATRRAPECDREHRPAYESEGLAVYSGLGVRKLARIAARVNQLYYADNLAVLRELLPSWEKNTTAPRRSRRLLSRAAARVRRGGRGGGSLAGGRGGRERLVSVARRRGLETS